MVLSTDKKKSILSLVCLIAQNSTFTILVRLSRVSGSSKRYLPTTAVFLGELIKMVISIAAVVFNTGFHGLADTVREQLTTKRSETIKTLVPAVAYMIQNNLQYVGASNLSAAQFQVLSQAKLVAAAIFSRIILHKHLNHVQWLAVCCWLA